MENQNALYSLSEVIKQRKENPEEGSYTCYLFEKGIEKILKKCGEENSEMIIAAMKNDKDELANEICDLLYHILVMMEEREVPLDTVMAILDERSKKIGNLKQFHQVDRNS